MPSAALRPSAAIGRTEGRAFANYPQTTSLLGRRSISSTPTAKTPTTTPSALSLPSSSPLLLLRRRRPAPSRESASSAPRRGSLVAAAAALRNIDPPLALLFDCDGVLLESEAVGHRNSFNAAFREEEALQPDEHEWSEDEYGRWLKIGGGKERMDAYFRSVEATKNPYRTIKDEAARKELMLKLHKRKTDLFMEAVETGRMPLRPGVKRLVQEAIDAGVKVAVCSTSNERAVTSIVKNLLGPEIAKAMPVFAGDVVARKKPAPDIYLLAAKELGVDPARCVVIEDSEIGLAAGRAAGMRVVVTKSRYTEDESFENADAVFDCIGDEGDERFSLDDLSTPGALEEAQKRTKKVVLRAEE